MSSAAIPQLVVAPRACGKLLASTRLRVCEDLPSGDRAATAAISAEVARLGRAQLIGIGPGGALALLVACTSDHVAGCALVGGALVYPRLDAAHPNQPLELALNLACPLHVFHGADDPDFPPAHLALARAKLEQFARDATFHAIAGAGAGWCDPAHPGYRPSSAQSAIERALAALAHSADDAAP